MTEEITQIYLKEEQDRILSEASPSEKYIILQNQSIQKNNKKLEKDLKKSQEENTELERENGKMEQQKTYMAGIIKNCVELQAKTEKVKKNIDKIDGKTLQYILEYKAKMNRNILLLHILSFSYPILFNMLGYCEIFPLVLYIIIVSSFTNSLMVNFKPPSFNNLRDKNKILCDDINTISVAQKHLDNYIEEL